MTPARRPTDGQGGQVVVTGAGGWIGRNALSLLAEARSTSGTGEIIAVGQHARRLEDVPRLGSMHTVTVADLANSGPPPGSLIIHCGFPTQDRVEAMGEAAYLASIQSLRTSMADVITRSTGLDVIYLSSGAATSIERGRDVPHRTRVYGQAKIDDEEVLRYAVYRSGGRLCVVRAFALSGPYMTKPETYALGNMILQAVRTGWINVSASTPVRRSYMAIDDMLRIAIYAVRSLRPREALAFETAGEIVEVGDLAERVLAAVGGNPDNITRSAFRPDAPADDYVGDPLQVEALAARAGVTPLALDAQIVATSDWLRGRAVS